MARPIARTLLNRVTKPGAGERMKDTESFKTASLQFVYTGKMVSVELKGRMVGSPVEATLTRLDSLMWKSDRIVKLDDWPVGVEEVWAEVLVPGGGEVSLYFVGCE